MNIDPFTVDIVETRGVRLFNMPQQLSQMKQFIADDSLLHIGNGFTPVNLSIIKLPQTLESIGQAFLKNNTQLQEFIIPEGVSRIGFDFMYGSRVKKVTNSKPIYSEKLQGFLSDCQELEYVRLDLHHVVMSFSFWKCTNLQQVQLKGKFYLEQCFIMCDNIRYLILHSDYKRKHPYGTVPKLQNVVYASISASLLPSKQLQNIVINTHKEYRTMLQLQLQKQKNHVYTDYTNQLKDVQNEVQNMIEFGME